MPIKHHDQSGRGDNGDPGAIQPSEWNKNHDITGMLALIDGVTPAASSFFYLDGSVNAQLGSLSTFFLGIMDYANAPALLTAIGAAPLNSAPLTGSPTAPTATVGNNSTLIATTAFVSAACAALVASAPSTLDTLNEIATALGDDPNFATTMTAALGYRVRFDAAQTLTTPQQVQAAANLGLATVARSGAYTDLSSLPTLGTAAALNVGTAANQVVQLDGSAHLPAVNGSALTSVTVTWGNVSGKPSFATVATSGLYTDLSSLPTLGTAAALNVGTAANNIPQLLTGGKLPVVDGSNLTNVTVTWSNVSSKPSFATVATSGSYNDLSSLPTLGTAAALNVGTAANNVVQLLTGGKLPVVDGSNLTNVSAAGTGGVRYDITQSLTAAQRTQARANITAILRGQLSGLTLSAAGSTQTFGIAAGEAADSTAVDLMALGSAYTKTAGAWAVGTGNGSFDGTGTGPSSNTNTWYHVFAIKRPDTGVVDILTSLSATAPTLPTNYTIFRRIGSMRTDATPNWIKFSQLGDEFLWDSMVQEAAGSSVTTTAVSQALTVPPSVQVQAMVSFYSNPTSTMYFTLSSPDSAAILPAVSSFSVLSLGTSIPAQLFGNIRTDTSRNIRIQASGSTTYYLNTRGWIDRRGRDA